jgi:hypothetical protein
MKIEKDLLEMKFLIKYLNEDRINIQNFLTEKLKILDNDCQIRLILTQYLNN